MARSKTTSDTKPGEQMRVASYLRVSTEEQRRSGLGLKDQCVRTMAMAQAKGWPQPSEYADEGISGTRDETKRPGLRALLDAARAGQIDAVIVSELSRIGRRTKLVLGIVEQLAECGVALVRCKESLDTTTPTGQFVLTMFAALAQLERDQIADRTAGALVQLVRDGKDKGGRIPFDYVRTDAEMRVAAERAVVVRRIFPCGARARRSARLRRHSTATARQLPTAVAGTPQACARCC